MDGSGVATAYLAVVVTTAQDLCPELLHTGIQEQIDEAPFPSSESKGAGPRYVVVLPPSLVVVVCPKLSVADFAPVRNQRNFFLHVATRWRPMFPTKSATANWMCVRPSNWIQYDHPSAF